MGEKQMECGSCGFALGGGTGLLRPGREKADRLGGEGQGKAGHGLGLSVLCHWFRQLSNCLGLTTVCGHTCGTTEAAWPLDSVAQG